jgi:hypothetical protein
MLLKRLVRLRRANDPHVFWLIDVLLQARWTGEERFIVRRVVIRVGRRARPENHHRLALRARGDEITVACDDLTHVAHSYVNASPAKRLRLQPPSRARG